MAKFLKIYDEHEALVLLLNKDAIESYTIENGGGWTDIVIGNFMYSIQPNLASEYSVCDCGDCIPDCIKKVNFLRITDLIHGDERIFLDYTE